MMVALFVYAYAIGVRSSRAIERRCQEDVVFLRHDAPRPSSPPVADLCESGELAGFVRQPRVIAVAPMPLPDRASRCHEAGDAAGRVATRRLRPTSMSSRSAIEACVVGGHTCADKCERHAAHHHYCRVCVEFVACHERFGILLHEPPRAS
jgi:hypothetical protein